MRVILSCVDPEECEALCAALSDRLPIEVWSDSGELGVEECVWWLHGVDDDASDWDEVVPRARAFAAAGGRILATGAAAVPMAAGLADAEDWLGAEPRQADRVELLALPGEPLFRRSVGGFELAAASAGTSFRREVLGRAADVRVLAVDAADPARALLVERRTGSGRALFLGAGVEFGRAAAVDGFRASRAREQRARLCGDLVDYLANDAAAERSLGWPSPGPRAGRLLPYRPVPAEGADLDDVPGAEPIDYRGEWRTVPEVDAGAPFRFGGGCGFSNVAHRVVLHLDGLRCSQWWSLPVRWLRDVVIEAGADPLVAVARRVRTGEMETTFEGSAGAHRLVQSVTVDRDGTAVIAIRNLGANTLRLGWSGELAPELPPPFPAAALGPVRVRSRPQEIQVALDVSGYSARLRFDTTPSVATLTETGDGLVWRREFELPPGASVSLRLAGQPAVEPTGEATEVVGEPVRLEFGDARLDAAWNHLGARLADHVVAFRVQRDGVASAAVGELPNPEGRFEHRPADSMWTAQGWHLVGRPDLAAAELRLQAAMQSPDGALPWSIAPGGRAERATASWAGRPLAAADAMVLATSGFVEGVAEWFAWRRDRGLVDELWPAVQRALGALKSVPVSALGRIEAAVWCARAWQSAAALAHELADEGSAADWFGESERVRAELDERFGSEDAGRYAAVLGDSSSPDLAPACLAPIALGIVPTESMPSEVVARFSADVWATDWGVRSRGADASAPDGFDAGVVGNGAVTAVGTSLVAACDFALGRADCGFAHWTGQLLASAPATGDLPRAFDGIECRPAAGSDGPAASAQAAIMNLAVTGLLGWRPASTGQPATLAPTLPGGLDRVAFSGLTAPVADGAEPAVLAGVVRREANGDLVIELRRTDGGDRAATIELAPAFAWPCVVDSVAVDGDVADHDTEPTLEALRVRSTVTVTESVTVRFAVREDLVVRLRAVPTPAAEPSGRLRVVERQETPNGVELLLIGRCGAHDLDVSCFGRELESVEGAEIREQNGSDCSLALTLPDSADSAAGAEDPAARGELRLLFRFRPPS